MPDSLEDLRKFRFSWRASLKEGESFARALDSQFPGKLKQLSEAKTARGRRSQKRLLLAGIIPLLASAVFAISQEPHPEAGLIANLFGGLVLFTILMFVIMIIVALMPDGTYRKALAEIKKDIPKDVIRNIEEFQRRFEIDFTRSPFVVRRRRAHTGGNGGGGGGDGGGG